MSYILVIDDEPLVCWLVEEALRESGYRVKTAHNWQRGLALAREEAPALVLVDLKLPGKDGVAVLDELARLAPGVPGVLVTGEPGEVSVPQAVPVLRKPFDLSDLRRLVQEMVPLSGKP
ncbi:response regulator [Thermodesulfitimonas sp.]